MAPTSKATLDARDTTVSTSPTLIWIIVTASVVAAILVAAFVIFGIRYFRQERQRTAAYQTVTGHPLRVGSYALSTTSKKPSLSSLSSVDTESELQRQAMIQRSLAGRRSSATLENRSSLRSNTESDSGSVMSDWKEFEANLRQHPALSLHHHPGLQRQHPFPGHGDLRLQAAPTPVTDSFPPFPPSPEQISPPPAAVMGSRHSSVSGHGRDTSYFSVAPGKTALSSQTRYGNSDEGAETRWI